MVNIGGLCGTATCKRAFECLKKEEKNMHQLYEVVTRIRSKRYYLSTEIMRYRVATKADENAT